MSNLLWLLYLLPSCESFKLGAGLGTRLFFHLFLYLFPLDSFLVFLFLLKEGLLSLFSFLLNLLHNFVDIRPFEALCCFFVTYKLLNFFLLLGYFFLYDFVLIDWCLFISSLLGLRRVDDQRIIKPTGHHQESKSQGRQHNGFDEGLARYSLQPTPVVTSIVLYHKHGVPQEFKDWHQDALRLGQVGIVVRWVPECLACFLVEPWNFAMFNYLPWEAIVTLWFERDCVGAIQVIIWIYIYYAFQTFGFFKVNMVNWKSKVLAEVFWLFESLGNWWAEHAVAFAERYTFTSVNIWVNHVILTRVIPHLTEAQADWPISETCSYICIALGTESFRGLNEAVVWDLGVSIKLCHAHHWPDRKHIIIAAASATTVL